MLKIYVTFLFVHFSSKQLIFVYKHNLCTERLATGDLCQCIDIQISLIFSLSTKQNGQQKRAKWRPEADGGKLSSKRLLFAQNRTTGQ